MYILHDVYLEYSGLSAQIDYLVFTRKVCFVIECKNLYGNIEINNRGEFIRTVDYNGRYRKEGIYSPITQNQRHLELIRKIRIDNQTNFYDRFRLDNSFENIYKSVVVLANPRTVLNAKYAQREIKEKVIRADQLVKYIKDVYETSKETPFSDEKLLNWAQSFLDIQKEIEQDYTNKFLKYKVSDNEPKPSNMNTSGTCSTYISIEDTDVFKDLRAYRLKKSREENIKPYFIYNDNQLKDLINKMPCNKDELKKVDGFGEVKSDKYGADILSILSKYSGNYGKS